MAQKTPDGPAENGGGWWEFRGRTDARIGSIEREIVDFCKWRDEHMEYGRAAEAALYSRMNQIADELRSRIAKLEARVATFAAIGSAAGSLAVLVLQWWLDRQH